VHRPPAAIAWALLLPSALACGSPRGIETASSDLVDSGAIFDATATARVRDYLSWVRSRYGIDYRVVLEARAPDPPTVAAERWFRRLQVGSAAGGRGLLLWIDPSRRRARIEVGYALEGVVPDLSAAWMLDGYLGPRIADGDLPASVEAAIEALVDRFRPRLEAVAGAPLTQGSGGAGADTQLHAPPQPPADPNDLAIEPQADPAATRRLEIAAMRAGRYDPTWSIYDEDWRRNRRRGSWPPERLREIAARFDRPFDVVIAGRYAAACYLDAPELGPTLLRQESDGWIIDATAGARLIVYDYSNDSWYLIDESSPYVDLVKSFYPLERVRLKGGRRAWSLPHP